MLQIMKHQFLNAPEDIEWLKSTHLKRFSSKGGFDFIGEFMSFEIWGNEDSPYKICLYWQMNPMVHDEPIKYLKYNFNSGKWESVSPQDFNS